MKSIEVVAAIVLKDGKILATQRGYGDYKGWWEFPGGKIEPGESREDALVREIHEELDAQIEIERFVTTVDFDYPEFHLTMHCYLAKALTEVTLLEHMGARWLGIDELGSVNWLAADVEVVEAVLAQGIVH